MKRTFSTFEIVKTIPELNRNTFQSAISAGFVVPDIRRADGPGERSAFSLDGVYNVALFFRLVSVGLSRKKAAYLVKDIDLTWENVGGQGEQISYLEIVHVDEEHLNLRPSQKYHCVLAKDGFSPAEKGELFRWTISLLPIKLMVDAGIEKL